jgi:hypothetical protein
LCSVMACPSDLAFEYGLHALKWMYQTRTEGITARSDSNPEPISFVDSGWRPSSIDGKSTYGFVVFLFGLPIVWTSKLQPHVAVSTAHAEYMALALCARETIWLRQLMMELGFKLSAPTPLYGDNSTAIGHCEEDFVSAKSKFTFLPYQQVKAQNNVTIKAEWTPTKINVSDLFTKSVSKETFEKLRPALTGSVLVDWDSFKGRTKPDAVEEVPIIAKAD